MEGERRASSWGTGYRLRGFIKTWRIFGPCLMYRFLGPLANQRAGLGGGCGAPRERTGLCLGTVHKGTGVTEIVHCQDSGSPAIGVESRRHHVQIQAPWKSCSGTKEKSLLPRCPNIAPEGHSTRHPSRHQVSIPTDAMCAAVAKRSVFYGTHANVLLCHSFVLDSTSHCPSLTFHVWRRVEWRVSLRISLRAPPLLRREPSIPAPDRAGPLSFQLAAQGHRMLHTFCPHLTPRTRQGGRRGGWGAPFCTTLPREDVTTPHLHGAIFCEGVRYS